MATLAGIVSTVGSPEHVQLRRALGTSCRGGPVREILSTERMVLGARRSEAAAPALATSGDGSVILAFDGTIFNLAELSPEAKTSHTSRVLVSLYRHLGPDFVAKLDGTFALALWDARERSLLLARDQLGTKPLFYSVQRGSLGFASEFGALLTVSRAERKLDLEALNNYLTYLYVPAPRTLLEGVRQVGPGQLLRFLRNGELTASSFLPPMPARFADEDPSSWSTEFREQLAESLQRRLGTVTNAGFLLSGGTDTAALVGCATKLMPERVKTFTLGFPDAPEIDERAEAKETATALGTEHIELEVDTDCIAALPKITRLVGSPVSNPASLISCALFEQIRGHVDAVVCGDGGNEILGGVYKYNQAMNFALNLHRGRLRHKIQGVGQTLWYRLRQTPLESLFQRAARAYFGQLSHSSMLVRTGVREEEFLAIVDFYVALETYWSGSNLRGLYTPETRQAVGECDPHRFLAGFFARDPDLPALQQVIWARTNTFIPYNVMRYVEHTAIAAGLEPLFPYLDQRLLDFVYRVPFEHIYAKAYRHFMRESLGGRIVPDQIFRKPLRGFSPPTERWVQTPRWRDIIWDHLAPEQLERRGLFNPDYVTSLLLQYDSGRRSLATDETGRAQPLGSSIWSLVALEAWCREFLD